MSDTTNEKMLAVTEDLKPILSVLKEEDAQAILVLKEELTDNWQKKQIFRTETEMRVSVLNDAKHPTAASKYWQSVREMSAHFDGMMGLSFDLRRNAVERMKLERKMEKAIEKGDDLKIMELEIDLDQNLYGKANMEQVAHDRVRELKTWSKIKDELNDGTFDDRNVNTHQAQSLQLALQNRVQSLGAQSSPSEVINAVGPLQTIQRLKTEGNTLLDFKQAKLQLQAANPETEQPKQ
jgi:hypothetical protein